MRPFGFGRRARVLGPRERYPPPALIDGLAPYEHERNARIAEKKLRMRALGIGQGIAAKPAVDSKPAPNDLLVPSRTSARLWNEAPDLTLAGINPHSAWGGGAKRRHHEEDENADNAAEKRRLRDSQKKVFANPEAEEFAAAGIARSVAKGKAKYDRGKAKKEEKRTKAREAGRAKKAAQNAEAWKEVDVAKEEEMPDAQDSGLIVVGETLASASKVVRPHWHPTDTQIARLDELWGTGVGHHTDLDAKKNASLRTQITDELAELGPCDEDYVSNWFRCSKRKMKKEKEKEQHPDDGAPPLAPCMNFCKITRPKIVEENPTFGFGAVGKKLGEAWRGLSDDDKATYRDVVPISPVVPVITNTPATVEAVGRLDIDVLHLKRNLVFTEAAACAATADRLFAQVAVMRANLVAARRALRDAATAATADRLLAEVPVLSARLAAIEATACATTAVAAASAANYSQETRSAAQTALTSAAKREREFQAKVAAYERHLSVSIELSVEPVTAGGVRCVLSLI